MSSPAPVQQQPTPSTTKPSDAKKASETNGNCAVASQILDVIEKGVNIVQKICGRESGSKIVDMSVQDGYSEFHVKSESEIWVGFPSEKLHTVLNSIFRKYFAMIPESVYNQMTIDEVIAVDPDQWQQTTSFYIDFVKNNGETSQGQIVLKQWYGPNRCGVDTLLSTVAFFRITGRFTLAPIMVREVNSKKSFFRSSSVETIRYIDRPITQHDIEYLTKTLSNQIVDGFVKKY